MPTIVEKILQEHSEEKVEPGKIVWIDLDIITAREFGGPNVVKHLKENFSGNYVAKPESTFFTFDLSVPAKTLKYALAQNICRKFAKEVGIKVFDINQGIGTHVLIDRGVVKPGMTAVGTDSHYNILGAMGVFGQGMGDKDIAFAFKTGKTWFEVPETMKVIVEGKYNFPTVARDLTFAVMRELGPAGALGRSIEYYGDAISSLSIDGRITLASQTTEMGGIIGFTPMDEKLKSFYESKGMNFKAIEADKEAEYVEEIHIDVNNLEPLMASPPNPCNVHPVSEYEGMEIDGAFIGSCTNGRYEDLVAAAKILKGKKLKVPLTITPTTREIWLRLMKEGIWEIFAEAGAVLTNPGCGGCAEGMPGLIGDEVYLSTTNRNYPGKQGPGKLYLVSPVIAAASAVEGKVTVPRM
ncbi:homoaconitate hydratase family protein [Aciduliprofundum boonei T469]|nr:homoaconitate hydratase family protein [Aciduliprofundum boonei T469]